MTNLLRGLAAAGILVISSTSVNATLIDFDTFTTDTISGFDWLDVTSTINQSYDYVNGQFGVGGLYEGWSYASTLQFAELVSTAGPVPISNLYNTNRLPQVSEISGADVVIGLLGSTSVNNAGFGVGYTAHYCDGSSSVCQALDAITSDMVGGQHNYTSLLNEDGLFNPSDILELRAGEVDSITSNVFLGSLLVRDTAVTANVPEPATFSLLGLGLLVLGFTRRKAK